MVILGRRKGFSLSTLAVLSRLLSKNCDKILLHSMSIPENFIFSTEHKEQYYTAYTTVSQKSHSSSTKENDATLFIAYKVPR